MRSRRTFIGVCASVAFSGCAGLSRDDDVLPPRTPDNDDSGRSPVSLADQGLENGDVIDGYLDENLRRGTEVHIPAGTYEWRGTGLSGEYDDAALVGDGTVTFQFSEEYWNVDIFAVDGGNFTLRNITIRGPVDSNDNKSRFRFDARDGESKVILDNFNLPDGDVGRGRAIGIYVGLDNQGTVHLNNCYVEGFPNNGLYAGQSGLARGGGGRVVVEGCSFKNNNIDAVRLGGNGDVIRNCEIVQEEVPATHDDAKSGRGIRVRYPGGDITIENVRIRSNTSSPFIVPDRAGGPDGRVNGLYIENNTDRTAALVEQGSFTADTVYIRGSGNLEIRGFTSLSDSHADPDLDAWEDWDHTADEQP